MHAEWSSYLCIPALREAEYLQSALGGLGCRGRGKKGRREREGKRERMEDMAFSEVLKQVHSDGIKIKKVDCTGNWSQ